MITKKIQVTLVWFDLTIQSTCGFYTTDKSEINLNLL